MSTVPDAERTRPFPNFRPDRAEQERRFGGIRWGSAFFGWVTAMGMAILLGALVVAVGASLGLLNVTGTPAQALDQATRDPATALTGAIVLLCVLFVGYYCGGYVAGRMARFAGARQGVAVWLWALVVAVVGAVLSTVAGVRVDGLPGLPTDLDALTTGGIALGVGVLVVTLVAAVLGGLAGMRYHRRIDRY